MDSFNRFVVSLLNGDDKLAEDMFYDYMLVKQRTVDSDRFEEVIKPLINAEDFSEYEKVKASLKSPWEYRGGTGPVDSVNAILAKYKLPLKLISISPDKKTGSWFWEVDGINKPIEDRVPHIPMFENTDEVKDGSLTSGEHIEQGTASPVPEFDEKTAPKVIDVPEHPNAEVNGFDLEEIKYETSEISKK